MFLVVLDKICVFCLYHIPDSQQYVKRGSCRRLILSGLLCLFLFWALGPFMASFEFGPRTLSFSFILFIESLSHLVLVVLFYVYFAFNCYLSLNVILCSFRIMSCFRILSMSDVSFFYLIMFVVNRVCLKLIILVGVSYLFVFFYYYYYYFYFIFYFN